MLNKAPERRSSRVVSARPARNPHRRWWGIVLAVLLIGVGITTAGIATAPPAQAGFMGICDADTSFPLPARGPGHGAAGTPITIPTDHERALAAVALPEGSGTPVAQYGGAGLTWFPWGQSCMDAGPVAQTTVANLIFEVLALWPARLLGVMLDAGFNAGIVDGLLSIAEPVVEGLADHVFMAWAPVVIMLGLIIAIWRTARGQGRRAVSQVAWMVGVVVLVTGMLTTSGIGVLREANRYVQDLTACVTFGTTGVGCEGGDEGGRLNYASAMVESLAADAWALGALGDQALERAPERLVIPQQHDSFPKLQDAWTVTVPVDAIPAARPGKPTWGEVWRWTQTYTAAELRAMDAAPDARCAMHPQQSPGIHNVTNGPNNSNHLDEDQLCSLKWLVRAGVIAELAERAPDALSAIRGEGSGRITAALASGGVLPLALGIGVLAAWVLVLQLELVLLVIAAPVAGLFALRDPQIGRRWGEAIVATVIKRIAVGLTLGLVLWAMGAVARAVRSMGWVGLIAPLGTSVLTIGVMIAGYVVLRRVQAMLLTTVHVDDRPGAAESGAKKLALTGVAAVAGAATAGGPLRLEGALRGAGRAGLHGVSSIRGAFSAGAQGGHGGPGQRRDAQPPPRLHTPRPHALTWSWPGWPTATVGSAV